LSGPGVERAAVRLLQSSVEREQCGFIGLELVLAGFKRHLAFNEPEVTLENGPARSKLGFDGWLLSDADALLVSSDLFLECLELSVFRLGLSLELVAKSIHLEGASRSSDLTQSALCVGELCAGELDARFGLRLVGGRRRDDGWRGNCRAHFRRTCDRG
jgi:hypothetical protein